MLFSLHVILARAEKVDCARLYDMCEVHRYVSNTDPVTPLYFEKYAVLRNDMQAVLTWAFFL